MRQSLLYCLSCMGILLVLLLILAFAGYGKQITVAKDGSGDYHTIQAAIDAASSGDTVYVKAGTYQERINLKSGITLQGEGRDVTSITYSGDAPVVTVKNATSVTITGLTVRYTGTGDHTAILVVSARLSITHSTVTGAKVSGIEVRDSESDVVITDNLIHDNQTGIFIYKGARGTVRKNEMYGNGFHGIEVKGAGTDPLIEDNVIHDNAQDGLVIRDSAHGTLRNNEIYQNGFGGIEVREGSDPVIEDNVIHDNTQGGLLIQDSAHGTLRNNEIYQNGFSGIEVKESSDPLIENNTIVLNHENGIWMYDQAAPIIKYNIVVQNGDDGINTNRLDFPDGHPILSYNDVWGNKDSNYEGLTAPSTDISVDPQFADPDGRDFSLRPSSPCIAAGEDGRDLGALPQRYLNEPPIARFVFAPVDPDTGTYVQFNASTSADPDGTIVSYNWSFGDGDVAYNPTPTHSFSHAGIFTVTLTVTDNDGATSSVSKTLTVKEANQSPTASFTWQALSSTGARLVVEPRTGDRIQFDAFGSSDPDGTIVKYAWDWESNGSYDETTTDPVIEHVFSSSGSHRVTLRVTDDAGATATITKTVTIGERKPPQAEFNFTPSSPSILDTVQFTDKSTDSDGEIKSWKWDFGDGSSSTATNPTHQYTQKKPYTVKLTVTDDDGLTDVITKQLTAINLIPTAAFSFSPQQAYVNQPVSFDASSSTDKDGTITGYAWDFTGDGTTDAQGEKTTWTFAKDGTYTVTLTVTDDDGDTASQQHDITVSMPPAGPPKFKNLWGLVVGIADYKDPSITDLQFTESDAQAFYDFLVDRNAGGFPKDHVRLLLGKDATLVGMRKGLDWLSTVAGADDLVVFYYAGHGATVPDKNHDEAKVNPGDNLDECLVPYDADYSSLAATTLVDDAIGYWFSNLSSQHVLMVFDSCFSGGASREVRSFGKGGSRAAAGNAVFTDMAGAGRIFLAASRADQSSFENATLKHGVFTYFLLRGLGDKDLPEVSGLPPITKPEADKDGDGRVTVKEMEEYLDAQVPPYVRQHEGGGDQTPVVLGDENLRNVRLDGYGVPLVGEVTAIQGQRVIISLGSRQGIQPGDRFEVIRPLTLPDGTVVNEVEATIEVIYILGPDRAGCKVVKQEFTIQVHDYVQPVSETGS